MRLQTMAVLAVGLCGCFHEVRPEPKVAGSARERLPLRVKYYLPPGERARVDNHRYFNLGIVHTWNIEVGEALADSFPQMLGTVFASVTPATGPTDVAEADVFVSPALTSFDVDGGSFVATLKVRFLVLGSDREAILEEEVTATTSEDDTWFASWGGAFTGNATLRTTTERAFEQLMARTAGRLFEKFEGVAAGRTTVSGGCPAAPSIASTGACAVSLGKAVGESGSVKAIDLSPGMRAVAANRLRGAGLEARVELVTGDAAKLPWADGHFDALFSSFVLELFDTPELPAVLAEWRRVLREGGRMVLVSLVVPDAPNVATRLYGWAHRSFPSLVDCRPIPLRSLAEAAGLRIAEVHRASLAGLAVETLLATR